MRYGAVRAGRWLGGGVSAALVALSALAPGGVAPARAHPQADGFHQTDPFPHEKHQGLFPLCTGCHAGIPGGEARTLYPEQDLCTRCHDGVDEERVEWSGPTTRPTNLRFEHPMHASKLREVGDSAIACESCHGNPDGPRMAVGDTVRLPECWSCHAHPASDHLTDADCTTCHDPLARTRLPLSAIKALPVPPDHDSTGFLLEGHGASASRETARCETCHTRERCAACHVDADRPEITAIAAAPADLRLPEAVAHYERPASHVDEGWQSEHGTHASRDACATCHATEDCAACHIDTNDAIASLPSRAQVVAPGVHIEAHAPDSHRSRFFMASHATLAAADDGSCATCHTQTYCTECHDGPSNGGFHPLDFATRHGAEAYGREEECSTCHNAAAFCRSCHVESGLGSEGRLGAGYHDAEPLWLIRHGQAARQSLESCASCHKQRECVQCHGVLGAFKISPHTRDFDARAAWKKNPTICLACHVGNPIGGSRQ